MRIREVRAETLLNLRMLASRGIYVFKIKWTVDNYGEVGWTCMRIPVFPVGSAIPELKGVGGTHL